MNRAYIEIILIVTIAANVFVYNTIQSDNRQSNTASNESPKILEAASGLIYHSKMIATESVIIAKYSVKLMFSAVNKAI